MSQLKLITGVKEYEVANENGKSLGIFRCNPADPNIGVRFQELEDYVLAVSHDYDALENNKDNENNTAFWDAIRDIDQKVKEKLVYSFGQENDFDQLFAGMHVMSLGHNGQPIIFNFLEMIAPVVTKGVADRVKLMDKKVKAAKEKQAVNRAQRRAQK